jgi:hypothetical protein
MTDIVASAKSFANVSYSYTGAEVRVWVHDLCDEIERLRAELAEAPPARQPLSDFERMKIIGDEFPIALVQQIIIAKVDVVCRAVEQAHGIKP